MYKIAESATNLANCIVLNVYSQRAVAPSCASTTKHFIHLI